MTDTIQCDCQECKRTVTTEKGKPEYGITMSPTTFDIYLSSGQVMEQYCDVSLFFCCSECLEEWLWQSVTVHEQAYENYRKFKGDDKDE